MIVDEWRAGIWMWRGKAIGFLHGERRFWRTLSVSLEEFEEVSEHTKSKGWTKDLTKILYLL